MIVEFTEAGTVVVPPWSRSDFLVLVGSSAWRQLPDERGEGLAGALRGLPSATSMTDDHKWGRWRIFGVRDECGCRLYFAGHKKIIPIAFVQEEA